MKKTIIFIAVSVVFFWNHAWSKDWSEKPIIDNQFREIELEIDKVTNECREKEKNVIKKMKCGKAFKKEYEKQGKLRGTDEYCKKHYKHLRFDKLKKVLKELKKLRKRARIASPGEEIIPGEVSEGMFMVEQFWVESRLAQLQKKRTAAAEKEVFKESEKGREQ